MPTPTIPLDPTDEQQAIIDLAAGGYSGKIEAGAGTGKTTTLGMAARAIDGNGTYAAFNKAIANDAARAMPMGVDCRTVHSIAYRTIKDGHRQGRALLARTGDPRVSPWDAARALDLQHHPVIVTVPQPEGAPRTKVLQPTRLASHVMKALAAFCNSADAEPAARHFPYLDGIDPRDADGRRTYVNNDQLADHLLPALHRAWADVQRPDGRLRFTHDVYVKLWQLGRYEIPGRFVLFDEAQDASPVMLAALAYQADQGKQVLYVGDSQQQIYEWRGAVNALATVDATLPRRFLTQSWRFGPAVAEVANVILRELDADLTLIGNPDRTSIVHVHQPPPGDPDVVLCRTNGAAVNALLSYQARGLHPHLVGGTKEIVDFAHAAAKLQNGETTGHPDLACFDSWPEVQAYVADDPGGDDLRTMVKMLDDYGPQIVIDALSGLVAEDAADVVISTAHRAKGREWPHVRLAADFTAPETGEIPAPELRLLYVACTRATTLLDVRACEPVRRLLRPVFPEVVGP